MGSTLVVLMETLPSQQMLRETPLSQWLPALTHTTAAPALESVWSVVLLRNGKAGGKGGLGRGLWEGHSLLV